MSEYILEFKNISKSFPGVKALDGISFGVKKGETHAIVGENGAGKSTLMKVLTGAYQPDKGEIIIKGNKVSISGSVRAIELGIAIVYQELNLIPELSVADNIFLGREGSFILDDDKARDESQKLLKELKLDIDPGEKIKNLSIGNRQLVEIVKAIHSNPEILIMDEPTSSLSQAEIDILFTLLRKLKSAGCTILYISHKLEEIFAICESLTVLRNGQHISTMKAQVDKDILIALMVNKKAGEMFPQREYLVPEEGKEEILRVEDITRNNIVEGCSFSLRKGEILGFSGLMGAGRTELFRILFGLDSKDGGRIFIEGKEVKITKPAEAIKAGIAFITEDRRKDGLVLSMSVKDNMTLPNMNIVTEYVGVVNARKEAEIVESYKTKLNIKTTGILKLINYLSGGNQQKVIIARWLMSNPKILIMDEPTRGIDIGAKSEIYQLINELSRAGMGIILCSSEMEEIMVLCDRIMVMHDGRIMGEMARKDATAEKILKLAFGGRKQHVGN
ncbi:MAG: hypothetical protein A2283_20210 [Lentisphaerae bacterium RIFOXYA12_FULL_48_11]|nr:MAG: hypothetical protein A2283_20210 [Lentisphaerae bacterium RIFOXYA12_FULL_48_11]